MDFDESLKKKLVEVNVSARQLGLSLSDALDFLQKTMEQRVEVLMRFNERISDELAIEYLESLFKERKSLKFVEAVKTKRQNILLKDEERHKIEVRQRNKCALCGKPLHNLNRPHIDHRVPISLHGDNQIENLQILCAKCNLGKGAYLGWPLAAPFYEDQISPRVRFFALSRAKGRCEAQSCMKTWLDSDLSVHQKVRSSRGGRFVLDNLKVLCKEHAKEETEKTFSRFQNIAFKSFPMFHEEESLRDFKLNFKKLARNIDD